MATRDEDVEVVHPALLPAGGQGLDPFGVGRTIAAFVHGRGRALENVKVLRILGEIGDALDGRRAGADNRHALVGEFVQVAGGITASVAVVPTAGVEGVALVGVDAGDAGQFGPVQRPVGHDDEACPEAIIAVGSDDPAALLFVPGDGFDLGLE